MTAIPRIETERLVLRAACMSDWPAYAGFLASERSSYMGGPFVEATAWGMFCHDVAQWSLMGHGSLMVDRRNDGCCVGQVGINAGPLFPEHELGWLLYQGEEGNGYAFEAARAMRGWAFRSLGLSTMVSYVHPDNRPSRRLAERLGGVPDETAQRHGARDLVYRYW